MNAYEIDIWRSAKHNGEFAANANRFVIIHARNEREARAKIKLAEPYTNKLTGLTIDVSAEVIYSVTKIGTVTIQPFYVYSGNKSSISVEEFKKRQTERNG